VDKKNQVAGTLFGLYLDRDRNLGILNSWNDETSSYSLSGTHYAGTGLWEGAGRVSADYILLNANELPQQLTAQNFSSAMLRDPEERTVFNDPGLRPWGWDRTENPTPDVRLGAVSRNSAWLATVWPSFTLSSTVGVWQGTAGGEYSGDAATWAGREFVWDYPIKTDVSNREQFVSVRVEQVDTMANTFAGNIAGVTADWTSAQMVVSGGQVRGLFDPANPNTWMATKVGTFMDAKTFFSKLNVLSDDAQRAAMEKAMQIPCFEVGRANFLGTGNNMTVSMSDVQFLRYSTEVNPRIWGTGDVQGSYSAAPVLNVPVTINAVTGGNMTGTFTMQNWNTGIWGAAVNGTGALNRTDNLGGAVNIDFKGAAAGVYTGSTTGSFSGTAGGVVTTK
jgi:hypothetical protein